MNKAKLGEILADLYKKRLAISEELDSMASDPVAKKTKRYNKLFLSQDLMTKRIVDLEVRLGDDNDKDIDKMKNLLSLVEWARKHQENKKTLTTFKHFPPGKKQLLLTQLRFPEDVKRELEELLEKKQRRVLLTVNKRNCKTTAQTTTKQRIRKKTMMTNSRKRF